jgi:hypothetical protein
MNKLSAIPMQTPYIDQILSGEKTWEIRSKFTKKIGQVALIRSKSGTVVGTAELINVVKITEELAEANFHRMGMMLREALDCVGYHAWVLIHVVKFKAPVPYKHPYGAVTWVTLDEETTGMVMEEARRSA